MFGLTSLGIVHTLLGVVALVSGFGALARYKQISWSTGLGRVYLATTVLTAVTALGIFRHGGFGPAHGAAILTLVAVAIGTLARARRYVAAIAFSTTLLFHLIPAVTETLTRIPADHPIAASQQAPLFPPIYSGLLLALVIGLVLQVRWLKGNAAATA